MHRGVTLFAKESSRKLKYLKLEERKRSCYTVLKDPSKLEDKKFRVIHFNKT